MESVERKYPTTPTLSVAERLSVTSVLVVLASPLLMLIDPAGAVVSGCTVGIGEGEDEGVGEGAGEGDGVGEGVGVDVGLKADNE